MSAAKPAVVDASVAVKWVVEEEFSDRAEALLEAGMAFGLALMAPPHFTGEVLNGLYQRTRRQALGSRLSEFEAFQAVEQFLGLDVRSVAPDGLYSGAFTFAREHRQANVYDALYVVLARMLRTEFWTADLSLLRAVGTIAPWVRWIGEYEPPNT